MINYTPPRGAIWLANAFVFYIDKAGAVIDFFNRRDITSPDQCRTPQELRNFAASIQKREPGFAADLIAAADRAER